MSKVLQDKMPQAAVTAMEALTDLRLNGDVSLASIQHAVETRRGRPLRIVEIDELARDHVCSLWLVTDVLDIVLHAPSDSALHKRQFILHEFAHMILGHDALTPPASDAHVLLPDIPLTTIRRVLARSRFDNETEVAAEVLADLLAGAIRNSGEKRSSYLRIFG